MGSSSKALAWVMLALNLVLIYLVATMQNMAAMWLMAGIMLLDSAVTLIMLYRK